MLYTWIYPAASLTILWHAHVLSTQYPIGWFSEWRHIVSPIIHEIFHFFFRAQKLNVKSRALSSFRRKFRHKLFKIDFFLFAVNRSFSFENNSSLLFSTLFQWVWRKKDYPHLSLESSSDIDYLTEKENYRWTKAKRHSRRIFPPVLVMHRTFGRRKLYKVNYPGTSFNLLNI